MFTGIVTVVGIVAAVERNGERLALTIAAPWDDVAAGESVAVNGACLTVVGAADGRIRVEAIVSTRGRTRFGEMRQGERVNLERALRVGDRMGGHWVQGHVDGLGEVAAVRKQHDAVLVDIAVPPDVAAATILHGSIALDGVSLTVNALPEPGVVQVALIPHTVGATTLGALAPGDRVHVEGDVIGKYVREVVQRRLGDGVERP